MSVRELFDRKRAQAAAELEAAEAEALASGKEQFVLAQFERLYGRGPQTEHFRRAGYYISHPECRTMQEYVTFLESIECWEDTP